MKKRRNRHACAPIMQKGGVHRNPQKHPTRAKVKQVLRQSLQQR